jgi:phosphatidylglycerol:prolipoprotein diacylglycerol transferase
MPDKLRNGDVFLGYLILYPLGRFWIEFFRPDAWTIGTLATAQWIAIGMVVLSTAILVLRHVFWDRSEDQETPDTEPPAEAEAGQAEA